MRPLALASILLLAACPGLDPVDGQDPIGDPTPDPTPTPTPAPAPAKLVGNYRVTSQFEVPATVAAPGPLGESLALLHDLSTHPAGALLDLAEAAGTPALGTLRLALPSTLEDRLEGWMNGYLSSATVNGVSPRDRIAALDAQVRSVLLSWELRSSLRLPSSGAGTHAPVALAFSVATQPIVVPVSATAPVTAGTGVTATVTWPAGGGSPAVAVGPHAMGVPFGKYALTGLDWLLLREYGTADVAGTLDALVDCAGLAASVAGRCVDVGLAEICVGHASELRTICEAGLAEAATRLEERILAIDFEAIAFASGTATVQGVASGAVSGTATATGLSAGRWSSTIDLGQSPEPEPATTSDFTAVLEPETTVEPGVDPSGPPGLTWCVGRPFTPAPAEHFDRLASSGIALLGAGHSMQDVIVTPAAAAVVRGKFAYGPGSKDLEGERVRVFVDDCSGWRSLGEQTTDADGRIAFTLPEPLPVGVYDVRLEVMGDATVAPGRIWILPVGTHLAISDIDGTLTTSDEELLQDVLTDLYQPVFGGWDAPAAWPGGAALTHALADRGWVVVYLTGRPYWLTDKTRGWLADGGFATGALHTTDANDEAIPTEAGVGAFKRSWLQGLAAQGFVLDQAYGNATTDVYAYAGAAIPSAKSWIIGPHGGEGGTNAVEGSWSARAAAVLAADGVVQPFQR